MIEEMRGGGSSYLAETNGKVMERELRRARVGSRWSIDQH
jgi:hypothetical protein